MGVKRKNKNIWNNTLFEKLHNQNHILSHFE